MDLRTVDNETAESVFALPLSSGRYLIYAPLHQLAFIGNGAMVREVREHLQQCAQMGPPGPDNSGTASQGDGLSFLSRVFQPAMPPADEYEQTGVAYDTVVLFLTNQCSLRCSYCYASSGEHPRETMPWEIARAAIDLVVREAAEKEKSSVVLGFHGGGEPTLNWDVLKQSVEHAQDATRQYGLDLSVCGAFNAYWPDHVTRFVLDNFTDLSVSFDGLPEIQNKQRRTRNGRGSYTRVARTLRALDGARFPYGIRMTVTDDSVHSLNKSISHICENFRPHTIQVEPVFPQGRAAAGGAALTDHTAFVSQFIKAFGTSSEHGINLFYSGARPEVLTHRFCLAACRALVVTPTGSVTTCFEVYSHGHPLAEQFIVGRYDHSGGFEIDGQKLAGCLERERRQRPECGSCFCRWHCAGDCATKGPAREGDAPAIHTDRCLVTQELTKFLILHRIKESGGLVWRGP